MSSPPLVTVICLCYNHSKFVKEAIESVLSQKYSSVQLIVVDDFSTDDSVKVITELVNQHPSIQFIKLTSNHGNCKAFNKGLKFAEGEYLIDLAADDVLLPPRVEEGVNALQQVEDYGIHFSDAELINKDGKHLSFHSERFPHEGVPQGDIYKELISQYFICPPSVMFKRSVIDYLGGYDETLTYEDFDFWIRSSRKFKYLYSPHVLVKKRLKKHTLANKQFTLFSKHSRTTYRVCEKILKLNRTKEEQIELNHRIWYEVKLNVRLLNLRVVMCFLQLWFKNRKLYYG